MKVGKIEKVPLFTTLKLQCAKGIITTVEKTGTKTISNTNAKTVATAISNATTNSASWSLSNEWNNTTTISESYAKQKGRTIEEAETLAKSNTGTYSLTNSNGGSSSDVNTSNGTFSLSLNNGHSNTASAEYERGSELTTETSAEVNSKIGAKYAGIEAEVGASIGAKDISKDTESIKISNSGTNSNSVGLDFSNETSKTTTDAKTWNTSSGYSESNSTSQSSTVSNAISELVSSTYGYGSNYSRGGINSESQAFASTESKNDEYSSTLTYYTSDIESKTESFSSTGNTKGGYRMVMAGTVHVFAVVGYDIATKSYFVYTYNVLDDETEEYLDYSFDESFNDYETSVIPFEVPYFVNDYVNTRIAKTEGLLVDVDTGMIVDYDEDATNPSTIINIPSYISVDNNDGTYRAIKITGIDSNVFKNNKNIVGVGLSRFITQIPDSAFEGCTSLKYINCPAINSIGNNAFKGCSSLEEFIVPSEIVQLGDNAFEGVPAVKVVASTAEVAKAAASCGADKIVLDISSIPQINSADMEFDISNINCFELQGKDKEYKGLSVKSDAATTVINGVTITDSDGIAIELSSPNVVLDRVTVDCGGYALVLKSDTTNVALNRTVNLMSDNGNTLLCKNINLTNLNSGVVGKLNVTGNMLLCGNISGDRFISISGDTILINEEKFDNYLSSKNIYFDADGGNVGITSKSVALNSAVGELPEPSRDYYTFVAWYTEKNGNGTAITADTIMTSLTDITVYAKWIPNDLSAWTLASEVPSDAQIVDRKYNYTQTYYTTSNSSSLSGWERYDSTSAWSDYGGWSDWVTWDPGASDSRDVQSETRSNWVDTSYWETRYHYYHYCCSSGKNYLYTYQKSSAYSFHEIWLNYELPYQKTSGGMNWYGEYWCDAGHSPYWFKADGTGGGPNYWSDSFKVEQGYTNYYTVWRYRDRSLIYTYYYRRSEDKETTSYPSGDNISNIREYVQYRVK